jgi:uncharacterized repeat protein (TIGR03803 family)
MKTKILILFLSFFLKQLTAQISSLHDFTDNPDGLIPQGALFFDGTFLYGTTLYGGTNDSGTVFKIKPDGTSYSVILNFTGSNGKNPQPYGSLISDGTYLYGMTSAGGANYKGVIFKILPDGTGYTKLLDFSGTVNGSMPGGGLVYDGTFLYGMASKGGLNNCGTLFKLMPDGTGFVKLLDFAVSSGSSPVGTPIIQSGFLYGSTGQGGPQSIGTIFKILPDGSGFTKIYDQGTSASLLSDGAFLYCVQSMGGVDDLGSIFKIGLDGSAFLELHAFTFSSNEMIPLGSLILQGNYLYGTTQDGGQNYKGSIFKIKPDGTGYSYYSFGSPPAPAFPRSGLTYVNGYFYGTSWHGGTNYAAGTVFKYTEIPTGVEEENITTRFTIFPNPSTGEFNIQCEDLLDGSESVTVEIYNGIGEMILKRDMQRSSSEIDLSGRRQGMYFIKFSIKGEIFSENIIIRNN